MAQIKISFINASTVVDDVTGMQVMKDLQTQVSRDFQVFWGVDAELDYVAKGQGPKKGHWWLTLLDNSDVADALGYHDLTTYGLPIGKAFVKTCQQDGVSWTVDASHELLEMLADPDINLLCFDENQTRLYAYEVGDPVQDDASGYKINRTLVSDFVLPAFFEPSRPANSTKFSHQGSVTAPLTLAPGGYMSYMDINSAAGWQQITAKEVLKSAAHRARVGSRREKRRTPRKEWVKSTVVGIE